MNILSGLGMAMAGAKVARNVFGAATVKGPQFGPARAMDVPTQEGRVGPEGGRGLVIRRQGQYAPPGMPIERQEKGRGAGGKALKEVARFRGSSVFSPQEPSAVVIETQADLERHYAQVGPAPREGDPPHFWALPKPQQQAMIKQRAAEDYMAMVSKGILGPPPPGYRAQPDKPEENVVVWAGWKGGVPSKGTVSRASPRILRDPETGEYYYTQAPRAVPEIASQLNKVLNAINGVATRIDTQRRQYEQRSGAQFNLEYASSQRAPEFKKIVELAKAHKELLEKFKELQGEYSAYQLGLIQGRMQDAAAALAASLKRQGRPAVALLIPAVGVGRIKGGRSGIGLTEEDLEEAIEKARGAEYRARTYGSKQTAEFDELIRLLDSGIDRSVYGRAIAEEKRVLGLYERFVQKQSGFQRGEKQQFRRQRTGEGQIRDYVPGEDLDGLGSAGGMMAPNIAIVDGLGAGSTTTALGIGSVALIAIGAVGLYKLFQKSATSA